MSSALAWVLLVTFFLWCAWWLWCVNWKKAWPVLAGGGWAPLVLLVLVAALAFAQLRPGPWVLSERPRVLVPAFWWHLGVVAAWAVAALLCGWLQGLLGWAPAEVNFDPPAHGHHGHHHGHGHH